MFNTDAIAYIPLFGTAVLAAVLFVVLVIVKTRKTAKASYLTFLSLGIVAGDCLYTATHPGMMRFVLLLLLAAAIQLPYLIMLAFGKPKEDLSAHLLPEEEEKKPEIIIE